MPSSDFHTQHSPFGAFASFTIGLHGARGGFGQALGGPAKQNVYVGWRTVGGPWQMLPFFEPPQSKAVDYTGTAEESSNALWRALPPDEFTRTLGWASDTWSTGGLRFAIYSPFDTVPDPTKLSREELAFLLSPSQAVELSFDNKARQETVEIMFGIGDPDNPLRPVADEDPQLAGFAMGGAWGFAAKAGDITRSVQGFSVFDSKFGDEKGLHRIASDGAIIFTVPAGTEKHFALTLGFYAGGTVTTGIEAGYYYTKKFDRLIYVLQHGLEHHAQYAALAELRDAELAASGLNADQQFLLAQATHSYLGSTELLEREGDPLWVANEGEYRMMNTFDLTVDHLFHELKWHPWTISRTLDLFLQRYSYRDTVHSPGGRREEGGISFTHDMGVNNQFSPPGRSSYECTGLDGCFSHMTAEQLVNWVLCACTYGLHTKDSAWLTKHEETLRDCASSLHHRDHPDPRLRTGIIAWDSDRCGHGSEITTYDSLDVSLGQSRNNIYLATKTWAAWLLLEKVFRLSGLHGDAADAASTADSCARAICSKFEEAEGMFPAVFEGGNQSRIIPAVEGLVFPLFLEMREAFARKGRFGDLMSKLEKHLWNILRRGVCLDEKTGAWKLSSTSTNTWMSKIALCQHVVREVFPSAMNEDAEAADAVHAQWESTPGCGAWAMCDQIESDTGKAIGSKYYPRMVTMALWLKK